MNKTLIGIIVTVVAGIILGLTTWNFAATQGAVSKKEHQVVHDNLDKKLDKIYDKLMEIYKEMPKQ